MFVAALIVPCALLASGADAGSAASAVHDAGVVDFDSLEGEVERPVKISGPDPQYTPEALAHQVQGTGKYRCILHQDGTVHDCEVVRSLPLMDVEIIKTLQARRYEPLKIYGKPVDVRYTFTIHLNPGPTIPAP